MKFQDDLRQRLLAKGMAESSATLYLRNLKTLGVEKNLKVLDNPDAILEKIKDYKPNTQRAFVIAVCSALSTFPSKKKLHDKYFKIMIEMKQETGKTEVQEKNWISWGEIMKKQEDLKEKMKTGDWEAQLQSMVLSLFTLIPPRRNEYQNMLVGTPGATDTNYLDLKGKKFVFNVFKTSRKDGSMELAIPETLMDVIKMYLKHHPLRKEKNYPFLVYADGSPLTQVNSVTRILNRVFGKAVGCSMLRHIYLTEKFKGTHEDMKLIAGQMSHSVQTQKSYIL